MLVLLNAHSLEQTDLFVWPAQLIGAAYEHVRAEDRGSTPGADKLDPCCHLLGEICSNYIQWLSTV